MARPEWKSKMSSGVSCRRAYLWSELKVDVLRVEAEGLPVV